MAINHAYDVKMITKPKGMAYVPLLMSVMAPVHF